MATVLTTPCPGCQAPVLYITRPAEKGHAPGFGRRARHIAVDPERLTGLVLEDGQSAAAYRKHKCGTDDLARCNPPADQLPLTAREPS